MKKQFLLLISIAVLGLVLRFYELGQMPVGFHRDEAYLGYNAYSILKTGKDISGNVLPVHLESFLYSPAGYSYFSIPFIWLFDLSSFSVRFASAIFGWLTVIIVFFLVRELFAKYKYREELALLSSFFLAISPWHINLSRTATENTIVTFFITIGIFLLLLAKRKGRLMLSLSFISFSITLLVYQVPRAFLPIFAPILTLFVLGKKKVFENKILIAFLYSILIALPVFYVIFSPDLALRIRTLSIFNHPEAKLVINSQATIDGEAGVPYIITRSFHNKVVNYSLVFLDNYTKHFSFEHLFLDRGLPDRYRIPQMGLLYIFELPLIIFALFYIFRQERRQGLVLLSWILIAPIGSALAFDDVPNLQRTLMSAPALSILSSYGLLSLYLLVKNKNSAFSKPFLLLTSFVVAYGFIYYLLQYYVQGRVYRPWYRNDGYKELVSKVNTFLPSFDRAVVTDRETAPTIFFLFYGKYPPSIFQKETENLDMRESNSVSFSKYYFSNEECPLRLEEEHGEQELTGESETLYVNSGLCEMPENAEVLETIRRVDNSIAFYVLKIKD